MSRAAQVDAELADPKAARDSSTRQRLGRERARLAPIVKAGERWLKLSEELAAARELLNGGEPEMAALARQEIGALEPETLTLAAQLDDLLTPQDPLDDRDAIVEIRAGTGGDEAALFAAPPFRMYTR
jgi:peptide chain release factor 1